MNSSYFYINDLRVHYLRWNLEGAGRPVVLLHGLASNARIWEKTAPFLAAADLAVLAPDQRGHGLTDKPDGDYGFETFYHDLAAFIAAAELERPVLVGHSWGAMVAMDYAARVFAGPRAPSALILVDGGMIQLDDTGATWEQTRERLTPPRLAGMPVEVFLTRLQGKNGLWQPDEQAVSIMMSNFEVSEEETISPRLTFERHMQIVRAMWEFKTYDYYARLSCPVRMALARPAEPLSSAEARHLVLKERGIGIARQRIPRLEVRWMEDSVHDIPLQRPSELAEWITGFIAV